MENIDIDKLEKFLNQFTPPTSDREFLVMQGCRTYGAVTRSTLDLNLCSDEKCVSCQQFHEAMEKAANNFKDGE